MNNKMTKVFGTFGVAFSLAGLIACGDEVTQINQTGLDMVSSVEDLPKCTSSNEGEQVFVKEDGGVRVCSDGKWFATMGSAGAGTADTIFVSKNDTVFVGGDFACTTEKLKDDSGIKIVCNGDSIGVVLNGADGKDGVDGAKGDTGEKGDTGSDGKDGKPGENGQDGVGCTVANENGALTITCGDKSVVMKLGEDGSLIGGEEIVLDSEQVAVSLDSVKGASQKGPFLSGSKVLVKELRDGRSLTQTGNNFDGKILNDKGEFRITARMLVSQYVMLEANGYYRNEVTGQNSNSPLTLFGITDVTGRDIVNINLLTHLEYERVYYLVTKEGYTVKKAKKKAQKEIFDILHIDNTNFSNSEDLSIAGSSDEDGALLAFSILFQGDRSVSQLTELLTRVSTAMEKEGKWEDATAKAEIADWAMAADTSDRLADIRGKVDAWKLGSMVPKFEPYIRNFWRVEHGLGLCGDSVKVGTVVKPTRGKANAEVRFICAETDGDIRWRIATDFEKDTYGWKDSTDGALKDGAVTKSVYVFDKLGSFNGIKGWRVAESIEKQHGGCREALYDSIRTDKVYAYYYTCDRESHTWKRNTNYLIIDTQYWPDSTDGKVKWGDSIGVVDKLKRICYVWDDAPEYKGWRAGNESDCTLGLMGCTAKRMGEMGEMRKAETGRYYNCANNEWTEITDDVYINTYLYRCTIDGEGENVFKEGDLVYGIEKKKTRYACESGKWRDTKAGEEQADRACTTLLQGEIQGDTITCDSRNWRSTIFYDYAFGGKNWFNPDLEYGELVDKRDGRHYKTIKIGDQVWMAENLNYADSIASPYLKGQSRCYLNDSLNCQKGGRYYTWTAAMDIDTKWQGASPYAVEGLIENPHRGICPEGWHIPSNDEWNMFKGKAGNYATQQAIGNVGWPNATNASGFTALPAGLYYGGFSSVGSYAYFWSASEYNASYAYYWRMNASNAGLYSGGKDDGFSVRCLQDQN